MSVNDKERPHVQCDVAYYKSYGEINTRIHRHFRVNGKSIRQIIKTATLSLIRKRNWNSTSIPLGC